MSTAMPASAGSLACRREWDRSVRGCKQCGNPYTPVRPEQIYCGADCRHSAYRVVQKARYAAKPPNMVTCQLCGATFPRVFGQGKRKFCPGTCDQVKRARPGRPCAQAGCERTAAYGRTICESHRNHARFGRPCDRCGKVTQRHKEPMCNECKRVIASVGKSCPAAWTACRTCGVEYLKRNQRRHCYPHVTRSGKPSTYVPKQERPLPCIKCGEPHVNRHAGTLCPTCKRESRRHAKHAYKARRRDRQRAVEPVGLTYLMKRDQGRCGICHRKVRADKQVPHPLAPTTDHIIPLGADGTHQKVNCQLAHFMCNTIKSDTGPGQLRWLG